MQTKKQSLLESLTNTAIGFVISLASTFVIFPLVGFESSASKNIIVTLFFTAVSILRGYLIRRFFNTKNQDKQNNHVGYLYCFECEIEMPVKEDKKGNLHCSNCRLRH